MATSAGVSQITHGARGCDSPARECFIWTLADEASLRAYRRIPRGRNLLDSSPSVTSSPVGASDWPAANWQISVIDPGNRFMSVMLMG
jgi:hypothetical protein